jgi:hypothetical protein
LLVYQRKTMAIRIGALLSVLVVALLCLSASVVRGVDIIREQVDTYRKIMSARGFDQFNASTLIEIYKLHDGDADCGIVCQRHVASYLQTFIDTGKLAYDEPTVHTPPTHKVQSSDWEVFYRLITTIYAGMISMDPYTPQEIHLALTNQPSVMKVMFASMKNLEQPFVQFLPEGASDWTQATSAAATNYTYTVPQKWWPIFTGVLYETEMTGLVPEGHYKYRVGGWDSANMTTRYSEEFAFHAPPVPTNPNRNTKAAFLADHGTFELFGFAITRKLTELLPTLQFEHTMLGGDLSYAGLSSSMPLLNIDKEDEVSVSMLRIISLRQ